MTARIGVIGTGWWATYHHIPALQKNKNADIVAICDQDYERLRITSKTFKITSCYTAYEDMLACEKFDGIIIATPHIDHAAPAIAALEAGCHVLIETPMAIKAYDCRAIMAASKVAGRSVMLSYGLNFTDFSMCAMRWVRQGRIGEIHHCVCQMSSALSDLFSGKPMLESAGHMFRPLSSTWADPTKAGGYGWGELGHLLAWLFYVSDLTLESIFCMSRSSKVGVDIHDAAIARAHNGAIISLSGAATMPKHIGMHMDIRIYGSEGCLIFNSEQKRIDIFRFDADDETFSFDNEDMHSANILPIFKFVDLCTGLSITNSADGDNGTRVSEALEILYHSIKTGEIASIAR